MPDQADIARRNEERERELAIARREPTPALKADGSCHWCLAPVGPRQLYCDCDCERDHRRSGYA